VLKLRFNLRLIPTALVKEWLDSGQLNVFVNSIPIMTDSDSDLLES